MVLPAGIKLKEAPNYALLTIDLGTARDNLLLEIQGSSMMVIKCEGTLKIRLDDFDNPEIDLSKLIILNVEPIQFERLYLTNTAQAGKEVVLLIGRKGQFRVSPSRVGEVLLREQDALNNYVMNADETVEQSVELMTYSRRLVSIYCEASTATDFFLDVSLDGSTWISGWMYWSAVTVVNETIWCAFPYLRLRSASAGTSGDTVTLILTAK